MTDKDTLIVTRTVTKSECCWLDEDVPEGTIVHKFTDYTYGCIGPNGIAVSTEPGMTPFFELPRDAVARDGGTNG